MRTIAALIATTLLCSCQTTEEAAQDPPLWGHIDCQRTADHPELASQFEQAKLVCFNRAQAAGVAGTASMPTGYGLGGAVASGISAGIAQAQIQNATVNSCMAEYGWMLTKRSDFDARCPVAVVAPPEPSPPLPPKKKVKTNS
jgi:hypothetical protein